jgi:hypothetical protein
VDITTATSRAPARTRVTTRPPIGFMGGCGEAGVFGCGVVDIYSPRRNLRTELMASNVLAIALARIHQATKQANRTPAGLRC